MCLIKSLASNSANVSAATTAQGPKWYNNVAWNRPTAVSVVNLVSDDSSPEDAAKNDTENESGDDKSEESGDSNLSDESGHPESSNPSEQFKQSADSESSSSNGSDDVMKKIGGEGRVLSAARKGPTVFSGPPAILRATSDRDYNTFEGRELANTDRGLSLYR